MKRTALIVAVLCWACAGGFAQELSLNPGKFDRIELAGKMNVVLVEGSVGSVEATLHNTESDYFSCSVTGGRLQVRLRPDPQRTGTADVKIVCPKIDRLDVSAASVSNKGVVTADLFELKTANGARAAIQTDSPDITVSADGNSSVSLTGSTLYLNIEAGSKARVDARALEARAATVSVQIGAEVFVWGTEKLDAKAGTGAVIYYKGTPRIFKPSTSLGGSVEQFSY